MPPSQHLHTFNPEVLQTPYFGNFYGSIIILSGEWRRGTVNSKLLIMTWSSWKPAPTQEPTKNHLIRAEDAPGNSKGLRSSVSGTWTKGRTLEQKMLLVLLLRKITRVWGALARRPKYFFYHKILPHTFLPSSRLTSCCPHDAAT